uniref:Uncharacterized protein n=1 Tax=Callithrix jacchus TaxID=9483 RepID=A0A8I4A3F2_CALJA
KATHPHDPLTLSRFALKLPSAAPQPTGCCKSDVAIGDCRSPSTLGGRGGWITRSRDRDHPGQHGETPSLLKIQKISWAWWRVPVIPAIREAEAGELPEPRRWRLW